MKSKFLSEMRKKLTKGLIIHSYIFKNNILINTEVDDKKLLKFYNTSEPYSLLPEAFQWIQSFLFSSLNEGIYLSIFPEFQYKWNRFRIVSEFGKKVVSKVFSKGNNIYVDGKSFSLYLDFLRDLNPLVFRYSVLMTVIFSKALFKGNLSDNFLFVPEHLIYWMNEEVKNNPDPIEFTKEFTLRYLLFAPEDSEIFNLASYLDRIK